MGETLTLRLWAARGLFLALAAAVIFARLLPRGASPDDLPGPDLLVCLTFAWVLRRPEHVPPLLIVGVFLVTDMLFLRPPGLWTLLMLGATEFLRAREGPMRDLTFPFEWATVTIVLLLATLSESVVLSVFMVPGLPVGVALLQALITLAVYPAVVAALWLSFGLRRAVPGEVDALGRRL